VEQDEVLDLVRESEDYRSTSSQFGERKLHKKDQKAILGSEWLGSAV